MTFLRHLAAILLLTLFGLVIGVLAVRAYHFEECGGYYNYRHSSEIDCSVWGR